MSPTLAAYTKQSVYVTYIVWKSAYLQVGMVSVVNMLFTVC